MGIESHRQQHFLWVGTVEAHSMGGQQVRTANLPLGLDRVSKLPKPVGEPWEPGGVILRDVVVSLHPARDYVPSA